MLVFFRIESAILRDFRSDEKKDHVEEASASMSIISPLIKQIQTMTLETHLTI